MLGYKASQMVNRAFFDFVDAGNKDKYTYQMAQRQLGKENPYELVLIKKNGGKVYTIISPKSIFDEDGDFRGSFAVITDITERKKMEIALRLSEERFKSLNNAAPIGIFLADPQGYTI